MADLSDDAQRLRMSGSLVISSQMLFSEQTSGPMNVYWDCIVHEIYNAPTLTAIALILHPN